jgi:hypothetical protein
MGGPTVDLKNGINGGLDIDLLTGEGELLLDASGLDIL